MGGNTQGGPGLRGPRGSSGLRGARPCLCVRESWGLGGGALTLRHISMILFILAKFDRG